MGAYLVCQGSQQSVLFFTALMKKACMLLEKASRKIWENHLVSHIGCPTSKNGDDILVNNVHLQNTLKSYHTSITALVFILYNGLL